MSKNKQRLVKFFSFNKESSKNRFGWRFWLNLATLSLIAIILWLARDDLVKAWGLIGKANLWVLVLIIPVQFASYYASTEIFFTYLRGRGQLKDVSSTKATAVALEFNFVNHVFPSAGVSGASYMVWRLGKLKVSAGQAAMSQIINYLMLGGTFMVMMVLALIWAVVEDRAASWIIMATTVAVVALIFIVAFGSFLVSRRQRLISFASWFTDTSNKLANKLTFGKKSNVFCGKEVQQFFSDFYDDFRAIQADKNLLKGPIIWGFISNILDVLLIAIAFWSLGTMVNLPILLIAFGASAVGSFLVVTPGGVGAYETVMIAALVAGNMSADVASAGVLLARIILILGTIIFGVFAYQMALHKYGRPDLKTTDYTVKKNKQLDNQKGLLDD